MVVAVKVVMAKIKFAQENHRLQKNLVRNSSAICIFALTTMTSLTLCIGKRREFTGLSARNGAGAS